MAVPIPQSIKNTLKGLAKQFRQRYVRLVYGFGCQELEAALRTLGLAAGDVVMVHSSFDRFEGFNGKPTDVLALLRTVVGGQGTILMPTIPFSGTAIEYVRHAKPFDVARTPSRMGLLTELFRRSPGVVRSIHPTHSVAAWGARAQDFIRDHQLAKTPCDRQTPYGRLPAASGKILLLGADIEAMTLFHYVEAELEPAMPFSPFTKESFVLRSTGCDSPASETTTRLFDPEVSRRRNLQKLVPVLRQRGVWKETRVGLLRAVLLDAGAVVSACRDMANGGMFCYD